MTAALFIVATPLGNLEDLSPRAARVLAETEAIAAEDTRRTSKLLHHLGLSKRVISYWSGREKVKSEQILGLLEQGKTVALVSDAGTPGVSDPGRIVVAEAVRRGFPVIPIPGPSAVTAALSVSGMDADRFVFGGFLPPKRGARRKTLEDFAREPFTVVFYEAPHRIVETLEDLEEVFGAEREVAVMRELTKIHEEIFRGTVSGVLAKIVESTIAGEYVIVIEGRPSSPGGMEEALHEVTFLMKQGQSRKDAVAKVAADYGLSRKKLYDASLGLDNQREPSP